MPTRAGRKRARAAACPLNLRPQARYISCRSSPRQTTARQRAYPTHVQKPMATSTLVHDLEVTWSLLLALADRARDARPVSTRSAFVLRSGTWREACDGAESSAPDAWVDPTQGIRLLG